MPLTDIDIYFDFQTDTRDKKEPDSDSKTLRVYQQLLWSKPLPNGEVMQLEIVRGFLKWKDMWVYDLNSDSLHAEFSSNLG